MRAGKSLALLSVAENYSRIGKRCAVFTSGMDGRFGRDVVASRIGVSVGAECFDRETVFCREELERRWGPLAGIAAILLDEAQFLTAIQVGQLHRLAHVDAIPVLCFGIRSDFAGRPFEGAAALGAMADEIELLRTVCACGRRASLNIRLDESGQRVKEGAQVVIGDSRYESVCGSCFYEEARA
jgi:thymidine kinase